MAVTNLREALVSSREAPSRYNNRGEQMFVTNLRALEGLEVGRFGSTKGAERLNKTLLDSQSRRL